MTGASRAALTLVALCASTMVGRAPGQAPGHLAGSHEAPLRVDASRPQPAAGPADYQGGSSRAPDGATLGVTDHYLTRNGQAWLPVMGELHFSRVPESEWEADILRMQSAGVNILSTYIIWIHHEEIEGQWDWSGQRDLRRFAELCQKHGMLLYPRLGPWAHGEARNGGLPDWVVSGGPVRQLDPKFMAETKTLYDQAGAQLRGLMWKDGGPVIGVQIENEYSLRGPGQGEAYLLALKKMAIAAGFDVPLYTVTGWDNAVVPPREFLPVYGGYPDAPWGSSRTELPPQEVYAFRFGSRVSGNMGMIGTAGAAAGTAAPPSAEHTPFLTAEVGGGMQDTYHRRLIMTADDIAAMMPVMLGSGVNLYGSYMFTGGQNPDGKRTTLQESQATHYPTDVPEKSYDFQAPIGEYGQERASLRLLKNWNYFLNDFGILLAPMPVFHPDAVPQGPTDLSVLRWSVRTDGRSGFLFVNNYVRDGVMPARPHVQFRIALPGGKSATVPSTPVDIPSGAYFAWPFGLDLDGVQLRYGTAQLMARLGGVDSDSFVFACVRGVRCELALAGEALGVEAGTGLKVARQAGATVITREAGTPGIAVATLGRAKLVLLSAEQAPDTWKVPFNGEARLLDTPADVFADGQGVTLRQLGDASFHFTLFPPPGSTPSATVAVQRRGAGVFEAQVPSVNATAETAAIQPAGTAAPVRLGPALSWRPVGVAQAPPDAAWSTTAARWSLQVHPSLQTLGPGASGVSDLFVRIGYTGDAAHLLRDCRLLDDDFYNGQPWLVGLGRYGAGTFEIEVLPLRSDAPIYLPPAARARVGATGQTVDLGAVTVLPQYQLYLSPDTKP